MSDLVVSVVLLMGINGLVQLVIALNITYERFFIISRYIIRDKASEGKILVIVRYILDGCTSQLPCYPSPPSFAVGNCAELVKFWDAEHPSPRSQAEFWDAEHPSPRSHLANNPIQILGWGYIVSII